MARPRASLEQRMRAYKLHTAEFGPSAIRKFLSEDFGARVVSLRTITTWISEFADVSPEVKELDSPFEFHKMEDYDLPWEAGGYLLDMWAAMTEYWGRVDTGLTEPPRKWTFRQARWWWRVHLAVPDAEDFLDVYLWSEYLVRSELIRDVLGEPTNNASIESFLAYLAYAPWCGLDRLDIYCKAVKDGRILREFDAKGEYQQMRRAQEVIGMDELVHWAWQPSDPAKDLPSKAFEKFLKGQQRGKLENEGRELKGQEDDQ